MASKYTAASSAGRLNCNTCRSIRICSHSFSICFSLLNFQHTLRTCRRKIVVYKLTYCVFVNSANDYNHFTVRDFSPLCRSFQWHVITSSSTPNEQPVKVRLAVDVPAPSNFIVSHTMHLHPWQSLSNVIKLITC